MKDDLIERAERLRAHILSMDSGSGDAALIGELIEQIKGAETALNRPWQPIETAPKDGTAVDLWSESGLCYTQAAWEVVEYGGMGERDFYGWTDAQGHKSIEKMGPFTHWRKASGHA